MGNLDDYLAEVGKIARKSAEDIRLLLSLVRAISGEDKPYEDTFAANLALLDELGENH